MSTTITQAQLEQLLTLIRRRYPDWQNLHHPAFDADAIGDKQQAVDLMRTQLGRSTYEGLLRARLYDEIVARLIKIAQATNLLALATPQAGDLRILYDETVDQGKLCHRLFQLLYGEAAIEVRLQAYIDFLQQYGPKLNYWTFPTYFLFLAHPDREMFVEPLLTQRYLTWFGLADQWNAKLHVTTYVTIVRLAQQMQQAFKAYGATNLVDVQSLLWVAFAHDDEPLIAPAKRQEVTQLFRDFLTSYLQTVDGQAHCTSYATARAVAQRNMAEITAAVNSGQTMTDRILRQLLPYVNNSRNRESGAWIHIAPTINGDLQKWYETAGWTAPNDWPRVAQAIFDFVQRCLTAPDELADACAAFTQLPYSKGFQAGTLTPILNALAPNEFALVNGKPVTVLNFLTGATAKTTLTDYPAVNVQLHRIHRELASMLATANLNLRPDDTFDMFCHWLVSVRKYPFSAVASDGPAPAPAQPPLAAPFSELFSTFEEAQWAFDLLAETLATLGMTAADERFALTLPMREQRCLHLNVGDWLVLGFQHGQLRISLHDAAAIDPAYQWYAFQQAATERPIRSYRIPYAMARPLPAAWHQAYHETLTQIAVRFQQWRRSRYRGYHVTAVADAVFDPTLRTALFAQGISAIIEPPIAEVEPVAATPITLDSNSPEPHPDAPFHQRAFELLALLHATPTSECYAAHKEEFVRYIEEPFKRVLLAVGRRLAPAVRTVMETEKRLFARFLKNDWGQGGAWDFYWGAFYPKGSKRAQDAQLSLWMNYTFLEFGFYIGNYASEQRARFQRNCERYAGPLSELMSTLIREGEIVLGSREDFTVQAEGTLIDKTQRTWAEFMRNPGAANCDASFVIPAAELLTLSFTALVERIVQGHQRLFPLVLAALEDDPMPPIAAYLEPLLEDEEADTPPILSPPATPPPPYTAARFLQETALAETQMADLLALLADKRQLILQGPPGTGKTYVAQRLAKLLTGLEQPGPQVATIQFHPAYGYEDFIEGIRPESKLTPAGHHVIDYPVLPGRFREFCEQAARHAPTTPYVMIIDEINRGNLARIFGELLYLLEYRQESVLLPYSGKSFRIPPNVYLIGTMNTADRSIALVDFALRRRFHFVPMAADPALFARWLATTTITIPYLARLYQRLCTEAIEDENYRIGPSYLMDPTLTEAKLERVWRYTIEPLLDEYYAENKKMAKRWAWESELLITIRNGG